MNGAVGASRQHAVWMSKRFRAARPPGTSSVPTCLDHLLTRKLHSEILDRASIFGSAVLLGHEGDMQTQSNPLTNAELAFKRDLKPVPEADWAQLSDEGKAVRYACEHSGMHDKSIAIEANVDNAVLSRAKTGEARLSFEALNALMDSTGCEAPLYAYLLRRGYDPRCLRTLETETERALREANEALEAERLKVRVLTDALRGNPT